MFYYVTPTTQARAAKWLAIFGTDELPVLARKPRRQETRHGQRLAYDLAVSRLHSQQLCRLAAYVSRQTRRPYAEALADVRAGWALVADGLCIVNSAVDVGETAVSEESGERPFLSPRWGVAGMVRV